MTQANAISCARPDLSSQSTISGYFAALMTVVIWSGYFLSLRVGVLSPLSLLDLSFIRYCFPGLLLLPVFIKAWPAYRSTSWPYIVGIILGSGMLFFLLSAIAMKQTSVMLGSTLIPSTSPVFVTLIALFVFKQPASKRKKFGLTIVLLGVMLFAVSALPTFDKVLLMGQGLLILCALIWAFFTVSVRQSGLKPLQVSALVVVPNAMIVIAWFLATTPEIELFNLSFAALLSQLIVQGLFVGIFSGWFYAKAISKLGAEKTSAIGAFTPIVASIAAFTILQEALEFLPLLGLCFTTVGVLIASRQS